MRERATHSGATYRNGTPECEAASVERVSVLRLRLLDQAYERVLPVAPMRRVSSLLPLALTSHGAGVTPVPSRRPVRATRIVR